MRARALLSIDVDAEIREVCREQLQGDWQLAAELARFALRRGAVAVEARRARRGFVLRCPGAACLEGELEGAACALDSSRAADERHRAVVAIERSGANALLWAGGAAGARLRIANRVGPSATRLELRRGRQPVLETDIADEVSGGFEVTFSARRFDGRRALDWLATASRFAPVPVTVDGRAVLQGFGTALRSVSLGRPVPGGIALTTSGDMPRLWLLRHGVLAARATVSGYPPFEAVLELGETTPEGLGPDELRRAAQPVLPAVLARVGDLIVEAAADAAISADPAAAGRICTLGLRAIRAGLARERLDEQPLVPMAAATDTTRLSVRTLRRAAARSRSPLLAVAAPRVRLSPGGEDTPVLRLDAEQQRLLSDLLGVRIERPRPRLGHGGCGLSARLSAARAKVRSKAASLLRFTVLTDAELLDAERRLLRRLEGAVLDDRDQPLVIHLIAGVGPVRRRGRSLLLPRHNPMVVRAVRLAASDPTWLYPVVLGLLGEHGRPAAELRERWREQVGP